MTERSKTHEREPRLVLGSVPFHLFGLFDHCLGDPLLVLEEKAPGPEGGREGPTWGQAEEGFKDAKASKEEVMLEMICIGLFLGLALSTLWLVAGLDRMMGDEP
jgi:hypothetical protein